MHFCEEERMVRESDRDLRVILTRFDNPSLRFRKESQMETKNLYLSILELVSCRLWYMPFVHQRNGSAAYH